MPSFHDIPAEDINSLSTESPVEDSSFDKENIEQFKFQKIYMPSFQTRRVLNEPLSSIPSSRSVFEKQLSDYKSLRSPSDSHKLIGSRLYNGAVFSGVQKSGNYRLSYQVL